MFQLDLGFWGKRVARPRLPHARTAPVDPQSPLVWKHGITVHVVQRPRARRYLLRLERDGSARLVIPRRGSRAEGLRFLERSEAWLLKRHAHWQTQSPVRQPWVDGTRFLFRGEEVVLRVENGGEEVRLGFADQAVSLARALPDYREVIHAQLRGIAERELPGRTLELAEAHGIVVKRVTVRAQRSRWGSCSVRGTISLNWRIIQAPAEVRDYLIIHELMHRKEMNHSARYWKLVAEAFPDYRAAEGWLKKMRLE